MSKRQSPPKTGQRLSRQRRKGGLANSTVLIFNQALAFHSNGQLAMADHLYRQVIAVDAQHAGAFHWLGVLEGQSGNPERALALLEQSVALDWHDPVAWNDLGTAQRVMGRREQSLISYGKALALRPEYPKVLCDQGVVLHELLRFEEAKQSLDAAYSLAPHDIEVLLTSARVLGDLGEVDRALDRCMAALAQQDCDRTQAAFAETLKLARFTGKPPERLESYIVRAIREAWGRPIELAPIAIDLLRTKTSLMQCVDRANNLTGELSLQALFAGFSPDDACTEPVLLALMTQGLVVDRALERFLTATRKALLETYGEGSAAPSEAMLTFLCALAEQCFANEYVFAMTDDEVERVRVLRTELGKRISSGAALPEAMLAILGSYFALGELIVPGEVRDRSWSAPADRMISRLIREPDVETGIRAEIQTLTDLEDSVSVEVRRQYEESPYPRWVSYPQNVASTTLDDYLSGRFDCRRFRRLGKRNDQLEVLIAGCGTGQHSIEAALLFRGARILAIDLSRASLAYAVRKTRELNLSGVEYAQADILELPLCGRCFDLIESIGVLHHLANPLQGLRALVSRLRSGGFLRIGLYSEIARRPVVTCRQFLAEKGFLPTPDGIRASRQALWSANGLGDISSILNSTDFFAASSVRDLLFHVQEHRFGLPDIQRLLNELGLDFLGFELSLSVLRDYSRRFPEDLTLTNLDSWAAFEAECPLTFSGMYQFWVQKPH